MKLFDTIEPSDVCQGALGNCWLLAAISGVAEFPNFLDQITFQSNNKVENDGN